MAVPASRNRLRWTAIVLMVVTGFNALAAGYSFVVDPSGQGLGMTTDYLRHSPFPDFFIPGLILFVMNGLLNLVGAAAALRQSERYYHLVWIQGLILVGWIGVQIAMVRDFNGLHAACLGIGMSLIYLGRKIGATYRAPSKG